MSDFAKNQMITELEAKALELRKKILDIAGKSVAAHVPSAFSCADIVTALYFHTLKLDPSNPRWPDRDRFLLSAGHKCLVQYCALNMKGILSQEDLETFEMYKSKLPGHPVYGKCPGVEASTGSLGHGFPMATGMAIAGKADKKDYRVFAILGDGECHEGSIWEAAMSSAKHKLDNLVAIVDNNNMSTTYPISVSMPLGDIKAKWESFGFAVRVINGNSMSEIVEALDALPFEKDKPNAIIANTEKGHGVPFMTNVMKMHATHWTPELVEKAHKALSEFDFGK